MVSIFVLFYFVFYNFCSRAGIGVFLEVSMEGVINFCFLFSGIGSCWGLFSGMGGYWGLCYVWGVGTGGKELNSNNNI